MKEEVSDSVNNPTSAKTTKHKDEATRVFATFKRTENPDEKSELKTPTKE